VKKYSDQSLQCHLGVVTINYDCICCVSALLTYGSSFCWKDIVYWTYAVARYLFKEFTQNVVCSQKLVSGSFMYFSICSVYSLRMHCCNENIFFMFYAVTFR